jgi:penicillin-binding protein 1A
VWVGYPQAEIPLRNVAGFPQVFGGSIPARIWHDFMVPATRGLPVRPLPTVSLPPLNLAAPALPGTLTSPPPGPATAPPVAAAPQPPKH